MLESLKIQTNLAIWANVTAVFTMVTAIEKVSVATGVNGDVVTVTRKIQQLFVPIMLHGIVIKPTKLLMYATPVINTNGVL